MLLNKKNPLRQGLQYNGAGEAAAGEDWYKADFGDGSDGLLEVTESAETTLFDNTTTPIASYEVNNTTYKGTTFTATATGSVSKITLRLSKTGDIGNIEGSIWSSSSAAYLGDPTRDTFLSNFTINNDDISSSFSLVEIILESPVQMVSGRVYGITLGRDTDEGSLLWSYNTGQLPANTGGVFNSTNQGASYAATSYAQAFNFEVEGYNSSTSIEVNMKEIYENEDVTGVTTALGTDKGLNKGVGTYDPENDVIPNFSDVTILAGSSIVANDSYRYYDTGHTYFKANGIVTLYGGINENGCGADECKAPNGTISGAYGGTGWDAYSGSPHESTSGGSGYYGAPGGKGGEDTRSGGPNYYHGSGGAGYATFGKRGLASNSIYYGLDGYQTATVDVKEYPILGVGGIGKGSGGGGGTYGISSFGSNSQDTNNDYFLMGSAGGQSINVTTYQPGGEGGGKVKIACASLVFGTGGFISANGADGGPVGVSYAGGQGGGSGGAIWVIAPQVDTSKLEAVGGNGGTGAGITNLMGGDGGDGRIRVDGECLGVSDPAVGFNMTIR